MKETTMDTTILKRLPIRAAVHLNAQLRDYTTFKLGGGCPALIECPDAEALMESAAVLLDSEVGFIVIGQGSNLLVSDAGIESVVLRYCADRERPTPTFDGCLVRVAGNILVDHLAEASIAQGLGDISFCSGIPGTLGGAIAGNAGAFGRQIGDVVESVRLMEPDGTVRVVPGKELGFEYRYSVLKDSGAIVLEALLKLESADIQVMKSERERILELRRSKHPDWRLFPCAGSVFRNIEPTSAVERRQAAGWFLEEAGVKAFRVGGARLFEKHANIIVAEAGATAQDVFKLSEKMVEAVRKRFGLELVREIKLIGVF